MKSDKWSSKVGFDSYVEAWYRSAVNAAIASLFNRKGAQELQSLEEDAWEEFIFNHIFSEIGSYEQAANVYLTAPVKVATESCKVNSHCDFTLEVGIWWLHFKDDTLYLPTYLDFNPATDLEGIDEEELYEYDSLSELLRRREARTSRKLGLTTDVLELDVLNCFPHWESFYLTDEEITELTELQKNTDWEL